jgi:hypothetical protein
LTEVSLSLIVTGFTVAGSHEEDQGGNSALG